MAMTFPVRTTALALALTGATLTLPLTGCDQQSQQFARMQGVLDQAMADLAEAGAGSIPGEAKGYDVQSLQVNPPKLEEFERYDRYRQKRFDAAISDLNEVAAGGSDAQRAVALRMLAAIDNSAARDRARQASDASAALTAEASANLMELLSVIERTDAAGTVLDQNDPALVEELSKSLTTLTEQREALADQVKVLSAERDTALSKEKAQRELSAKKVAEAQAFSSQAFTASGDEKYTLLDRESDAKREAAQASGAADTQQQAAEALAVQLKPLEQRLALTQSTIETLQEQRDNAAQRQENTATSRDLLATDRDKAYEELLTRFEKLTAAYNSSVAEVFDQARGRAESAAQRLSQAEKLATGSSREGMQIDRLTALGNLTDIHARRAAADDSMARLTQSLIAGLGRTGVTEQPALPAALTQFEAAHQAASEAAQATVGEAETLAGSLGNDASQNIIEQIRARTAKRQAS